MRFLGVVIILIAFSVSRVVGQITVIDYTCCAQVATNMSAILAQEGTQKSEAEEGEEQQKKALAYTTVIQTSVSLSDQTSSDSDEQNLIDPKARLDMTNRIILNLRRSYNILLQIRSMIYYNAAWGAIINDVLPWQKYVNIYMRVKVMRIN